MYLDYWGFRKFPFENVPDPDFFYLSKTHEEGLTRLIYAAKMRKGAAMLSGDIGCGKTTLAKVYVQKLSVEQFDIGLIINPKLELNDWQTLMADMVAGLAARFSAGKTTMHFWKWRRWAVKSEIMMISIRGVWATMKRPNF